MDAFCKCCRQSRPHFSILVFKGLKGLVRVPLGDFEHHLWMIVIGDSPKCLDDGQLGHFMTHGLAPPFTTIQKDHSMPRSFRRHLQDPEGPIAEKELETT